MFVLIMGAIGSKSRSPGQILVKFFLHSLSYIFGLSTVTQVSDAGPSWPSCFIIIFGKLIITAVGRTAGLDLFKSKCNLKFGMEKRNW